MNRKILFQFIFLFTLASQVSGQIGLNKARHAGSYLEIPVGIRAAGLGTAFVAVADDGSAFHWNPAGAALTKGKLISTEYSSLYGTLSDPLSTFIHTGFQMEFDKLGAVSLNWVRLSVDDIPYLPDADATPDMRESRSVWSLNNRSYFTNSQDAFYLTFSRNFTQVIDFGWQFFKVPYQIPVGVNVKYLRQSFGAPVNATSTGLGVDAGMMIITDINDYSSKKIWGVLSFGLTVNDLTNTIITWQNNTQFSIPRSLIWGTAYKQPLTFINSEFLLSYQSSVRYETEKAIGVEYTYDHTYSIRAGSRNSELTLGAGLFLFGGLSIDYAFETHDLGNPHRVGVSFNLESLKW